MARWGQPGPRAFRVFEQVGFNNPAVGRVLLLASINSIHYEGLGTLLTPDTAFITGTADPNDLTPVPEPATLLLFGLGLAGAAAARRRL